MAWPPSFLRVIHFLADLMQGHAGFSLVKGPCSYPPLLHATAAVPGETGAQS